MPAGLGAAVVEPAYVSALFQLHDAAVPRRASFAVTGRPRTGVSLSWRAAINDVAVAGTTSTSTANVTTGTT